MEEVDQQLRLTKINSGMPLSQLEQDTSIVPVSVPVPVPVPVHTSFYSPTKESAVGEVLQSQHYPRIQPYQAIQHVLQHGHIQHVPDIQHSLQQQTSYGSLFDGGKALAFSTPCENLSSFSFSSSPALGISTGFEGYPIADLGASIRGIGVGDGFGGPTNLNHSFGPGRGEIASGRLNANANIGRGLDTSHLSMQHSGILSPTYQQQQQQQPPHSQLHHPQGQLAYSQQHQYQQQLQQQSQQPYNPYQQHQPPLYPSRMQTPNIYSQYNSTTSEHQQSTI